MSRVGLSRRQLLWRAGGLAGALGVGGGVVAATRGLNDKRPERALDSFAIRSHGPVHRFHSRPDLLAPKVDVGGRGFAPGYLFLGPGSTAGFIKGPPPRGPRQGPLIVDSDGELVWFKPLAGTRWATNFSASTYRGKPVLKWWEGHVLNPGFGQGEGVIVDMSYREVARVRAGNGQQADLHEFVLTPEGTALITCFPQRVPMDLSGIGGSRDAAVLEGIIQEVEVSTGRVLFEWRSLEHIPVTDSYQPAYEPFGNPYDSAHLNSIDVLPDGHLLVSARATFCLYKIDRRTGEVIWRMGGKRSNFRFGSGAAFSWQHHARHLPGGIISVFDNGAGPVRTEPQSRAIFLRVDEVRRTVDLVRELRHVPRLRGGSMGSVEVLPDGDVVVGWGAQHYTSKFTRHGTHVAEASLPSGLLSYRVAQQAWRATPQERPALAVRSHPGTSRTIVYVSWNGATDVSHWRVHTGASASRLRPFGVARRHGFETAIPLASHDAYVAITALDSSGRELAHSSAIRA